MENGLIYQDKVPQGLPFGYVGPSLDQGPMPAIIYFALSIDESLLSDPYNQPVVCLREYPIRILSFSLPHHGKDLDPTKAISKWAEEYQSDHDILGSFFNQVQMTIETLYNQNLFTNIGFMGLSRGGFISCHLAAKLPFITHILGFAPLIKLSATEEFQRLPSKEMVSEYDLEHIAPVLCNRKIRFYASNYDRRVKTEYVFSFIHSVSKYAHEKKIRSAPIELYIRPPTGYLGHGTPKETFEEGAKWLANELL